MDKNLQQVVYKKNYLEKKVKTPLKPAAIPYKGKINHISKMCHIYAPRVGGKQHSPSKIKTETHRGVVWFHGFRCTKLVVSFVKNTGPFLYK